LSDAAAAASIFRHHTGFTQPQTGWVSNEGVVGGDMKRDIWKLQPDIIDV